MDDENLKEWQHKSNPKPINVYIYRHEKKKE